MKKTKKTKNKKTKNKIKGDKVSGMMSADSQLAIGGFAVQDTPALTALDSAEGMHECLTFSSGKGDNFIVFV